MTERERTYIDAVFTAGRIYEQELREARGLLIEKKSPTDYMRAKLAAAKKRDAVEAAALRRYINPTASATEER